jgi:hypothetical protein
MLVANTTPTPTPAPGERNCGTPEALGGRRAAISLAHQRFSVRADEKLTAFVELERAINEFAVDSIL